MTHDQRLRIYLRGLERRIDGTGFYCLTPAQRRRLRKKYNRAGRSRLHLNSEEVS